MCGDVLQSADPSRGRLYGESLTNCPRFICESRFIIILLWWIDSWFNSSLWVFFAHGDSWFNSRFESPVNRVVSRPSTNPIPEGAENRFSGCAGNASRPRNKLRPRSPFSEEKNAGNRTSPGWMVWISALCTCAHTHACRKNRACAFLAGFRGVCCLFYRFPVRNALRPFLRCVQLWFYVKLF